MVWIEKEIYVKECGCACQDWEHDVDRAFMSYTEYGTDTIKRCSKHEEEWKERLAFEEAVKKREEEKRQFLQMRREEANEMLRSIEPLTYVPIKEAISKYRHCSSSIFRTTASDRYIQNCIYEELGETLCITNQKIVGFVTKND